MMKKIVAWDKLSYPSLAWDKLTAFDQPAVDIDPVRSIVVIFCLGEKNLHTYFLQYSLCFIQL